MLTIWTTAGSLPERKKYSGMGDSYFEPRFSSEKKGLVYVECASEFGPWEDM